MIPPDTCLTLAQIRAALTRVTYRGWQFTAAQHPFEGVTLRIVVPAVPDAYQPGQTVDLGIDEFLPPIPDDGYLFRWLAWRIGSTPADVTLTDAVVRTSLGAHTNPRFNGARA